MASEFDEHKLAKKPKVKSRRLAIPVNANLDKLILMFKKTYPEQRYSDTAVLSTLLTAGAKQWIAQRGKTQTTETIEKG